MGEWYEPKADETPVTMIYPLGEITKDGKPPIRNSMLDGTEYYGTHLTVDEIRERLLGLGYIDRSDEGNDAPRSFDYTTGQPLHPHRHEFIIAETNDWMFGPFSRDDREPRLTVQLFLYFNEWELWRYGCPHGDPDSRMECPDDYECEYNHNAAYEDYADGDYGTALELIDDDYYAPPKPSKPMGPSLSMAAKSIPLGSMDVRWSFLLTESTTHPWMDNK
jgi:hypothetical protein